MVDTIEAFVDIKNGRMTVIDDGSGITPEALSDILDSSSIPCILSLIGDFQPGSRERSLFARSGLCISPKVESLKKSFAHWDVSLIQQ